MKVNCHIDPNIEEEHLELFVREMNPEISNLLKGFTNNESVLWCYDRDQIIPIKFPDIFELTVAKTGTKILTKDHTYFYRERLSHFKSDLPNDFIEASGSTVFNYHYLELLDNGLIDVILTNGSHIQISRRKIKNLKARLGL
ncbi:LytTR family transcriptional regulator [Limosilactobacillus balticus]|uniref:LytTR family DNA-binding domain-containing protein n=1 Tax=Limosilactobacillus balticus TaxID=2759747 RepID=UPI001E5DB196|nr:LytTR family DNA-binding domain-containing protein [Limosilactobacillus balticus]MCD7136535.1 LytTR family transcriptional regulator [Limosilactobacillus balticus]